MKTLVTHYSPDRDGIGAIWLLKKFDGSFKNAKIAFVPAGQTLNNQPADINPDIVHVDTGFGMFDHHQEDKDTCAAQKVLEYLTLKSKKIKEDEALFRLVQVINQLDHAQELTWSEADSDRYEFSLDTLIAGWKQLYPSQDEKYVEWGCHAMDAIYKMLQSKVRAEEELKNAMKFQTKFGPAAILETYNDEVISVGQKQGLKIVARKDPAKSYLRIKAFPDPKIDLTKMYEMLKKKDPKASWFLHIDKHQLLNGSTKDPNMRPTNLSLEEIIEVMKNA